MGGIVKSLFGGSSSKQQSSQSNLAYPSLSAALSPVVSGGANTFNTLTDQLNQGFDAYKKNAGFDFALNRGQQGITGNAAAHGLLNSGSTQKALASFETGLGSQTYDNWLNQLSGASKLGIAAASPIAQAGQVSSSTGSSSDSGKGILGTLFG